MPYDCLMSSRIFVLHNIIPDPKTDGDYLSKVYAAAKLGHLEAMVKLGDCAYRRGAVVEAFYWTFLAEMKGAVGLDEALCEMRTQWLAECGVEEALLFLGKGNAPRSADL